MRTRRAMVGVVYLALLWFFGGKYGAAVGIAVLAADLAGVPRRAIWIASMAFLAQGVPRSPVVGSNFGTDHLVAHVLVGIGLAAAAYAGLRELLEPPAGGRPRRAHPER
ncbi:MAG: hypothetical protein E6G44_05425 [Actinobacteria bacterium]|nr:MAG: hypothetical protein E6G44_05425 [Actinomycetota bacterium]